MIDDKTMNFEVERDNSIKAKEIIKDVYEALSEKGYNPVNQIVGYILSGDPTYITSYKNARSLIRQIERDELLERMVKNYFGRGNCSSNVNISYFIINQYCISLGTVLY